MTITSKAAIIDHLGHTQQISLGKEIYHKAAQSGVQVRDYINSTFKTDASKFGSAFDQLAAQANVFFSNDFGNGIRKTTLGQMLDDRQAAGGVVREGYPLSRLIFPAVVLAAVEDRLRTRSPGDLADFDSMIAIKDTINTDKFTRTIFNYDGVVSGRRKQPISQLTKPTMMGVLTTSDVARKINTYSLGFTMSNEAIRDTTIDLFALSLTRLKETEELENMDVYINKILTGDVDLGQGTLAAQTSTAASFDPASTSAANFTHKAYMRWLRKNNRKCNIDWIICDLDAKMVLDNRLGRPTVLTAEDISGFRLNQVNTVSNVNIVQPRVFVTEPGVLPANTVIGLDSRYALHKVTNLAANYEATEELLMQNGKQFRMDSGEIIYRLYDDAFSVLTF